MRKRALILLFIILSFAAFALDLCDYPYMFVHGETFDPAYVLGEEAPSLDIVSATILSTAITEYKVKVGTSKLDSEISDVKKINAIVIGNPCVNKAAADLEGNPLFCYEGLEGGKGYAKLFSNNGKYQLLITGISAQDRKAMAEYLAENYLGNLKTKTFSINTYSGSKTPEDPLKQQNKQTTATVVETDEEEPVEITANEEKEETTETKEEEPKEEVKEEPKQEAKKEAEKEEPKEEKGFFGKIFEAIGKFFKYLFG